MGASAWSGRVGPPVARSRHGADSRLYRCGPDVPEPVDRRAPGSASVSVTICEHDPMGGARRPPGTWVIDLDGVVWLAAATHSGVGRRRGASAPRRVAVCVRHQQRVAHHRRAPAASGRGRGSRPRPDEIVTSAQAAASMLEPGSTRRGVRRRRRARGARRPGCLGRGAGAGRRRRGGMDAALRLRAPRHRGHRGAPRRPPHRHQRRPHPPHARGPPPGLGGDPRRGGHRGAGHARGGRASPTTPSWPCCARVPPMRCSWWGTGPPPTVPWPGASGCPSRWCAPGVTSDGREPMVVEPDEEAPDLETLVTRHLDGAR